MNRWSIKVIWLDGEEEYLMQGQRIATFPSRSRADSQRDFMLEGIADEVQSVNVVPAPAPGPAPEPEKEGA